MKDQTLSEHDCLFDCQDREKCQRMREDLTLLKERIERITDLYLDTMYPISPSLRKWSAQELAQREETLESTEPPESLNGLPENITYIDPKTATMRLEEIEKEFGLNESLEDPSPNVETSKSTTTSMPIQGDPPHDAQTLEEPLEDPDLIQSEGKEPSPQLIVWQIRCPRDKTQKIQKECLSSCKVWQRSICSEYQNFPQIEEDLSFKAKDKKGGKYMTITKVETKRKEE